MTTPHKIPDVGRPWVGIGWMMVTGLLFVCVTGIVRYIGSDVPAAQAAFIRYIIGLGIMLPFMGRFSKAVSDDRISRFIPFADFATRWACSCGSLPWHASRLQR